MQHALKWALSRSFASSTAQGHGLYAPWPHAHTLIPLAGGTLMRDTARDGDRGSRRDLDPAAAAARLCRTTLSDAVAPAAGGPALGNGRGVHAGVLVDNVKLSSMTAIEPSMGFWAFAVTMATIAGLGQSLGIQINWQVLRTSVPLPRPRPTR